MSGFAFFFLFLLCDTREEDPVIDCYFIYGEDRRDRDRGVSRLMIRSTTYILLLLLLIPLVVALSTSCTEK